MKKIRLGAVNWDASLTEDTYFGFYQINSLSQAKYRTWVPFYADIIDRERVSYHTRTPKEYEAEMRYAIEAGLDYFAFVWYPTEGSLSHAQTSFRDCSHKVHELNYARRLYEESALTDELGMCAILAAHPFSDGDLSELAEAFTKPYYEKIDGRPLLYVYGGYRHEMIDRINRICEKRGEPTPFVAAMVWSSEGSGAYPLAHALSAYAVGGESITSYAELIDEAIKKSADRITEGLKLIPTFTVGWDPSPRIERPTPWTSKSEGVSAYAAVSYAKKASGKELYEGAKRFADFIATDVKESFMGHVLTFAWNEFEEGGYFCPTYTENGGIDATRVEIFAKIAKLWREELGEI